MAVVLVCVVLRNTAGGDDALDRSLRLRQQLLDHPLDRPAVPLRNGVLPRCTTRSCVGPHPVEGEKILHWTSNLFIPGVRGVELRRTVVFDPMLLEQLGEQDVLFGCELEGAFIDRPVELVSDVPPGSRRVAKIEPAPEPRAPDGLGAHAT